MIIYVLFVHKKLKLNKKPKTQKKTFLVGF